MRLGVFGCGFLCHIFAEKGEHGGCCLEACRPLVTLSPVGFPSCALLGGGPAVLASPVLDGVGGDPGTDSGFPHEAPSLSVSAAAVSPWCCASVRRRSAARMRSRSAGSGNPLFCGVIHGY